MYVAPRLDQHRVGGRESNLTWVCISAAAHGAVFISMHTRFRLGRQDEHFVLRTDRRCVHFGLARLDWREGGAWTQQALRKDYDYRA